MNAVEWLMLVSLSLLWGGSFLFNGVLVQAWQPLTIVTARVALAALCLWIVIGVTGQRAPRSLSIWLSFLAMGLINNVVPFSLIVWGQTQIASGLAAILNATTPFFGVVIAHFLTVDEKLTVNRLIGVIIGIAGVTWMIGPSLIGHGGNQLIGELAVLAAALCYAFAGLYGRRFKRMGLSPIMPAVGQITTSALLLLPVAIFVDRPWTLPAPDVKTMAALIGLAVFSTALAYILFFRILSSAGATNLMLVTILIPPSAIFLSAIFLGEALAPRHFAGMALILVGLAAIDGRLIRRLRPR
ncbi:DMT family transporter [Rhizobium helianthi]